MVWVVVGLVLLFLMLRFPGFGAFVLIAVAGVALYVYAESERQDAKYKEARRRAASPERTGILTFPDRPTLALGPYSSSFAGSVTNVSSTLSVKNFSVRLLVYDCPFFTRPGCNIVGDETTTVFLGIPAKQKRSFSQTLFFRGLPTLAPGDWTWAYTVSEVEVD
ncbi:protein of unknown function [Hyphomicrobium sp. 1Nfss2.1]|uniref:hypothetical protein n=1 Tax=Hyphomicrobium sp. 1Nfss2.1 TaxID=3413936 RepID=UPI003C7DD298